jgi:hypothetical protein
MPALLLCVNATAKDYARGKRGAMDERIGTPMRRTRHPYGAAGTYTMDGARRDGPADAVGSNPDSAPPP